MKLSIEEQGSIKTLLDFIDESPTPWHAVANMRDRLETAGFEVLEESAAWNLKAGGRYLVTRDGSALGAFQVGSAPLPEAGFRIVGAHTDSPGLRLKPQGCEEKQGVARVGVDVYGGPILATWTDRELALAGRLLVRDPDSASATREVLVRIDKALLRLPNLAIHLNREVNSKGLQLDKQDGLPLYLGAGDENACDEMFSLVCAEAGIEWKDLLDFELCAYDVQPSALYGLNEEYFAAGRIDNLAMCHAGMLALMEASTGKETPASTAACMFYDNEEVGSQSAQGADGTFLPDLLERINLAMGGGREDFLRACSRSFLVSADMAHAIHPNAPSLYEPNHHVHLNAGPVIKQNVNLRYASNATSSSLFRTSCERAGVPVQLYVHRGNLPCGSTIGPMASAGLGIDTVDVGNPMLSMHSIRECAGARDHHLMIRALEMHLQGR